MTFYEMRAPVRKVLPAIVAGVALFLSSALSIGGVNLFGAYFGFGFIPLLVLTIWPRHANTGVSLLLVFLAGLFTDWGTGGIIGQWTLVYLVIWGFLRPELRAAPFSLSGLLLAWVAICGITFILIILSGWFVFGIMPDFATLGRQIVFASMMLPMALLSRYIFAKRISENEAWGR
jgi:hypothetical protein